jgi:hypothetical protein
MDIHGVVWRLQMRKWPPFFLKEYVGSWFAGATCNDDPITKETLAFHEISEAWV